MTLQKDELALFEALIDRYSPEELIELAKDIKGALPKRAERRFEKFKIEVDYLLYEWGEPPLFSESGEPIPDKPRYTTILAAIAQLRPEVGEERHVQLAKLYQQYRRRPDAKRGIRVDSSVPLG